MTWSWRPETLPLRVPYQWAKGVQTKRRVLLVELDGQWGECAPPPHVQTPPEVLADQAMALVHGLDPARDDFLALLDERRPDPRLRCGISTAYFCARAAANGESLSGHLGVPATTVPVNALLTGKDVAKTARQRWGEGIRTFKLKVGPDREADLRRVAAVREAVPNAVLRLDANESWDASWALSHMEALASFDVAYVEQPLPASDPDALVRLAAHSPVPVALDESATDAHTITTLLRSGAGSVVILKPQRLGGPDRTLQAIQATHDEGALAVVTNSLETAVGRTAALHLAALIPAPVPACGLDTAHYLARDVAPGPIAVEGSMRVPTVPGLGVDVAA